MASRNTKRWLHADENDSIIDFIYLNPGVKSRVIATRLMLPRASVNGFLYDKGPIRGVEIRDDYCWWPSASQFTDNATSEPVRFSEPDIPESNPVTASPPPAPIPDWFAKDLPDPDPEPASKFDKSMINNLPARSQSGWSVMGFLYLVLFGFALALLYKAVNG